MMGDTVVGQNHIAIVGGTNQVVGIRLQTQHPAAVPTTVDGKVKCLRASMNQRQYRHYCPPDALDAGAPSIYSCT